MIISGKRDLVSKNLKLIAGMDEAGRGPVLGPMVYGLIIIPHTMKSVFSLLNVNDSKRLSPQRRAEVYNTLITDPNIAYYTNVISAKEISAHAMSKKKNLNELSYEAIIKLLERAKDDDLKIEKLFLDAVGPISDLKNFIKSEMPEISEVDVSIKADYKYKVVGAASIIAKVTRDTLLENWKFSEPYLADSQVVPYNLGSGYTSDKVSIDWIKNNVLKFYGFPSLVRTNYITAAKILEDEIYWHDGLMSRNGNIKVITNTEIICSSRIKPCSLFSVDYNRDLYVITKYQNFNTSTEKKSRNRKTNSKINNSSKPD